MFQTIKNILGLGKKTDYSELVKQGAIVLDVRSKAEFSGGNIINAINVPLNEIENHLSKLPVPLVPSGVVSGTIQRAGNKLTCSLAKSTLGSISNCGWRPLRETITRARTSTFS